MLTTADIAQVLSHYDLGKLSNVTQASRGFVNETAFVQTATDRLVVRRNQRRLSEATQRYRHQIINRLYEQGFPTPALIPTNDGDTLLKLDGRTFEIMTFVKGEDFNSERPQQLTSVGEMLAHYHNIVRDMPPPPDENPRRYSPQGVLAMNETLLKRDMMGDLTPMLSWYDLRGARLRSLLPDETYDRLPHLPIHGDIHRDNVLFAGDQVVALLDYDQVAWDTPVADLADALVAFASVDKPCILNWGVFQGPLDEERAELLIEGYTRVAGLSPLEISMLPVLLEVLWLEGELGRAISTPEGDPDYHLAVLQQGHDLSRWLDANRERLMEQWTALANGLVKNRVTASAA